MKRCLFSMLAVASLVLAMAFPITKLAAAPAPKPHPTPAAAAAPQGHPEIHDAIESLRHAKEHLNHASHDYHGHRTEAIRAIDEAISQLQICLKFD